MKLKTFFKRSFVFVSLVVWATSAYAAKSRQCKDALTPSGSGASIEIDIADLDLGKTHFPEYEAFKVLQERYRKLNVDIDVLMDGIRDRVNSPLIANTKTLSEVNQEILAHIKSAQKITEPGLLRRAFSEKWRDESQLAAVMYEISFRRSKGQHSLENLQKELPSLNEFHGQLLKTLENVRNEISAIENLSHSSAIDNPMVVSVLARQIENLKTTAMIFENQIAVHHQLISAVIVETSTFENDLKNATRLLFAQGSPAVLKDRRLSQTHIDDNKTYDPEVQRFEPGTKVYVISRHKYPNSGDYVFLDPAVVTEWNSSNQLVVQGKIHIEKYSGKIKVKNRTVTRDPRNVIFQGCHEGICSDDVFTVDGMIWTESLLRDYRGVSTYEPQCRASLHKSKFQVMGYNPVRESFIVRNESSEYLWISKSAALAAKEGKTDELGFYGDPPVQMMSEKIKVGDLVSNQYGYITFLEKTKDRQFFTKGTYEGQTRIAKVGRFYGFYTDQKIGNKTVVGYFAPEDLFMLKSPPERTDWSQHSKVSWIPRKDLIEMAATLSSAAKK